LTPRIFARVSLRMRREYGERGDTAAGQSAD